MRSLLVLPHLGLELLMQEHLSLVQMESMVPLALVRLARLHLALLVRPNLESVGLVQLE